MIATECRRWWRRVPWNSNPLIRTSDRVVRYTTCAALAFALLLVPIAATFGSLTYSGNAERSQRDASVDTPIDARIIDVPTPTTTALDALSTSALSYTTVEWTSPDSAVHSGRTTVASTAVVGETVTVWVDQAGVLVPALRTGTDAAVTGIATAAFIWALGTAAAVGGVVVVMTAVDCRHMKEWDDEWRSFGRT